MAIANIANVLSEDIITERLLPHVIFTAADTNVNVKILCAKTLNIMKKYVTKAGMNRIRLCLRQLSLDPDQDVQYFALHES